MSPKPILLQFVRVPKSDSQWTAARSAFSELEPSNLDNVFKASQLETIDRALNARATSLSSQDFLAAEYYKVIVEPLLNAQAEQPKDLEPPTTLSEASCSTPSLGKSSRFSFEQGNGSSSDVESTMQAFVTSTLTLMHNTLPGPEPVTVAKKKSIDTVIEKSGPRTLLPPQRLDLKPPDRLAPKLARQAYRPLLRERPSILQKLTAKLRKTESQLR